MEASGGYFDEILIESIFLIDGNPFNSTLKIKNSVARENSRRGGF